MPAELVQQKRKIFVSTVQTCVVQKLLRVLLPSDFSSNADGVCVQSIEHPGCIWDAKFLENGDIVTACSDGTARIWTTNTNRFCSDEELAAYTDLISQYSLSRLASPVSYPYFLQSYVIFFRLEASAYVDTIDHGLCTASCDTILFCYFLKLFAHLLVQILIVVYLLVLFSEIGILNHSYKYSFHFPCFNRKTVGGLKLMDLPGVEALQVPGSISHLLSLYFLHFS